MRLTCKATTVACFDGSGGTLMFALLALAGDVGCSGGPALTGLVSGKFNNNLCLGIAAALVFPLLQLASEMVPEFTGRHS